MKLNTLNIENFMSLINVELKELPNLVVLIGKNSSGKSNLIDALALLFSQFRSRMIGSLEDYQHLFPNHNAYVNPSPKIEASFTLSPDEWGGLLSISHNVARVFEPDRLHVVKRLTVVGDELHWNTETLRIGAVPLVESEEYQEVSFSVKPHEVQGGRAESIGVKVQASQFFPRLDKLLESSFGVIHATENTRSWEDRFTERPSIMDTQEVRRLWELSQSSGSLRQSWTKLTGQFTRIAPNQQRPAGVASSVQLEEGTLSVPIGMTGEGSQAILRLMSRLVNGPAMLAIEEPETHLHPGLVKQVGQLLTETAGAGKQLFVCTHSPFLLSPSSLENLFVVKNQGSATTVTQMKGKDAYRAALLDIGMRPSDILFCDAVLLAEGLSEEIFFNGLSNKIGVPLGSRHIKIVPANGMPRGQYKIEFWAEVGRDAGLPLYLILDKNARAEADVAISKGYIQGDRALILSQGDLEDSYPWAALQRALSIGFNKEVEEPIPIGERVKGLKKLLRPQWPGNQWKPKLAEEVVQTITSTEAESEMVAVVGFLRKIYSEVGPT